MGCSDACPIFPGKRYLDWKLDDPVGQGVEAVRPIRDEIRIRIEGLLAELFPEDQKARAQGRFATYQQALIRGCCAAGADHLQRPR